MSDWQITFYVTESGRCPVEEFFDDLPEAEMVRMDRKVRLLAALGTSIGPPHVDHLRGKIWELRVPGRLQHRLLYVAVEERSILLLHGFTKKARKTPKREIEIAESRFNDYLERHLSS